MLLQLYHGVGLLLQLYHGVGLLLQLYPGYGIQHLSVAPEWRIYTICMLGDL